MSSWASVYMYRCPVLCTTVEVFRFLQDMPEQCSVRIPPVVTNELLCMLLIGPVSSTDLRA